MEKDAVDAFNSALGKARKDELSNSGFADEIERDVLPPWRAARERIIALQPVPDAYRTRGDLLLEYMRLRQEAWELHGQGARESNLQKIQEAAEKQKLAQEAA